MPSNPSPEMVCVPVEPTERMLDHFAGTPFKNLHEGKQISERIAYSEMLAARPATELVACPTELLARVVSFLEMAGRNVHLLRDPPCLDELRALLAANGGGR